MFEQDYIDNERAQQIAKSNYLIQKSKYELSARTQKVLLYCISKIKPEDPDYTMYHIAYSDICAVCGIKQSTQNYQDLDDIIKPLYDDSFKIIQDGKAMVFHWIEGVEYGLNHTSFSYRFDPRLSKYLFHLQENYTKFELECSLAMKSKYSIRMYELMRSYAFLGECDLSVRELKEYLNAPNYSKFADFRIQIIERSLEEINEYTDIYVEFSSVRQGRSIQRLKFDIRTKSSKEHLLTKLRRESVLDGK